MKAVLFDFGGTLDSDGSPWGERFFPLYKAAGVAASREAFDTAFYHSDDHLAERFPLKGLSLERTVALQVDCVLEKLAPQRPEVAAWVTARFIADCRRFFERNRILLEKLKKRYRLGIVSNFYGNLQDILDSERLSEFFDVVADSAVVGYTKPSREIFLHAAKALGAEPGQCLMIGDSVPRDMKGAEGLRMPHGLLNPLADACCDSALRLSTLTELEAHLS